QPWCNGLSLHRPYPRWLGAWPACVLFLLFAWLELVAPGRDVPRNIAVAILIYSLFTWAGFVAFGRDTWLTNGEFFSLAFALFGRFAPLPLTGAHRYRLGIRPFATGLVTHRPLDASMIAFAVLMLGTVTVDGVMETPQWAAVVSWALAGENPGEHRWFYMSLQ